MRHRLEIEVVPDGHTVTLRLVGELDLATVDTLRACAETLDNGFGTVVVDLSALQFLDSTGIGYLGRLHLGLQQQLRHLELRRASDHVKHVLELSGISEVIPTA